VTDRPADVGRGPLTAAGLCLFHTDLLPMDCTLVGRTGCVGCLLSRRNLDPTPALEPIDCDGGETRCPACQDVVQVRLGASGVLLGRSADGRVHRHPVDYAIPVGQEARDHRRAKPLEQIPAWERPEL
jgi:hypothetical protein